MDVPASSDLVGDDEVIIGTVPLIPDTGNRTLEFPNGVPIADTDNMTNGMYQRGLGCRPRYRMYIR